MLAKVVIAAKISNANNAYKKSVVSGAVSCCHQYRRYVGSSSQDVYPPASGSAGSADTGKEQPPLLPGLSPDQIRKIGEMDKLVSSRTLCFCSLASSSSLATVLHCMWIY